MSNQAVFESVTMELLRNLKDKKARLQERHAKEMAQIDTEIDAVSTTLRLLHDAEQGAPQQPTAPVIPRGLNGMSARLACIEIAKRNNGIVRVGSAKDALVSAGILKDGKNTWAIVYTTLQRSKEFEKGKIAGTFHLIEPQATLLQ